MNALSPWARAVKNHFHGQDLPALATYAIAEYQITVHSLYNPKRLMISVLLNLTYINLLVVYVAFLSSSDNRNKIQ